jgi:hypothetical protein
MAVHYPADYNVFSLVTIDDLSCSPADKSLIQKISDKIGREFIATVEDDLTLQVVLDLEQFMGREIIWLVGQSFDDVIKMKGNYLPNKLTRFCTTEMKLKPIFNWWNKNFDEPIRMGIGYRWDEKERADRFTTEFKAVVGKRGSKNAWGMVEWRKGWFPLIENKIIHPTVIKWANQSGIKFPSDSNCVGCFHKPIQQLRKNWEDHPIKMQWFADQEAKSKGNWKQGDRYENIKKLGIQSDFIFGTGSGCDAGYCTD